ncbi:glycosyltransferase family 4 protein [Tautonia plasticadhaerens]|uniref:D-inositol-3-phosphate glycosyltransferase n=1 Tax=Tautonia plasticadhaerens TaxID=2527974 RepID=A0A518H4V7_9BACT|nr:glycosyltransferase family 4 protein [Tautonia plasticadhaerens]QDV35861.1 D-inositol-3-phosphate glycosyltransferase [Tautonia plasticadhaerens]
MKALALVESPDHVCCRYRIRPFEAALAGLGWSLAVEGLARGPVARPAQLRGARRFDAVILQRKLPSAWEFEVLRRSSRRLVFDLDDAVFWRDSYHPRGQQSASRWARFSRLARRADAVIAGNDFLAGRALRAGAGEGAVHRIPTCVDPARYPIREHAPGAPVRLAWIGSSSTMRGIEGRRDLWDRIAREVPGIRMRVISDRAPDLGAMPVEFVPWSEATEAAALAECDAGVSWTPDDPWSRGKCGLKVLQYLAAGLPVVANPVGVHGEMVANGRSGFLVDSDDDWLVAVGRLADDADLRRRLGREARGAVERDFSADRWASRFAEVVTGRAVGSTPRPRLGPGDVRGACRPGPAGGSRR